MYEPNTNSLNIYGFKKEELKLFEVSKTEVVECDTLSSSLNKLNLKDLDYLKIDTQGAELEILKGLGDFSGHSSLNVKFKFFQCTRINHIGLR